MCQFKTIRLTVVLGDPDISSNAGFKNDSSVKGNNNSIDLNTM